MTQPSFLESVPATLPSSRWCIYEPACEGVKGTVGEARDNGRGCVNRLVTCLKCQRDVLDISTRKAQPEAVQA